MSDGPSRSSSHPHPVSPANPRLSLSRRSFIGGAGAAAALAALGVPPWLSRPAAGQSSPPSSGPQRYIGKQSMNPTAWPNPAPGWTNTTTTALPPSGGFSPIRLTTNNGTSSSPTPGFTEPVAVGDHLTFRIKVAPGVNPGGVRINYTTSGTTWEPCTCADLTVANPQWNMWNSASTSTVLVSCVKLADGTTEAVFRTIVQDATLQIGLSTATDTEGKQVDIWGLQVVRGDFEPWQPVGDSSVVFGAVGGGGLDFLGKQSMNPTVWPNPAPGWTDTTIVALPPAGGFSPIRLTTNNGTSSSPTPGIAEPLAAGDHLTFRIKVAPGANPGGVRINYTTSGTTWEPCTCPDLTVANPQWNMWNSASTSTVLVSCVKLADGTTEAVFHTIVQDPTLQIGLSTATDSEGKQVDIWGLQVVRGDAEWQPVGNTTVAPGSGVSSADLDFVAGIYQGGSLADLSLVGAASDELNDDGSTTHFDANTVRRTDLGVWVHGAGAVYIGASSQNPTAWPNPAPGWTDTTTTPLPPSGGFSPIRLTTNNGTSSSPTPGITEPLAVGDHLTYKIKVAPGATPGGVRINYTTSGTTWEPCTCADLTVANPQWNMWNSASTSTVLVSCTKLADGTTEAVFRTIVQDPTLKIGLSTATDSEGKQVDIWGLQVVRGDSDQPWVATATSTVSVAADDLELVAGSALDGFLQGVQGFCGLELQALAHSTIGTVGWPGSTQGTLLRVGTQDLLKPQGPTGFQTLSGAGALGLSGWRGIVRIAIAWDATGFSVFANGSKLQAGGSGVFNPGGAVKLLAGITGRLRRISSSGSRLADADLQGWTQLQNKTFLRPQNALVLGSVTQTYNDDYDGALSDSLRYQSIRNFNPDTNSPNHSYNSWQELAQSYDSGGPNAIWMPRGPNYIDDPTGMGTKNAFSTQALLYYIDPADGIWPGSHVVQSSCMELHLRPISQSELAQIPINSQTGQPFKYFAGMMTSYGFFQQTFGVFSSRDQMPAFQGSWPAWWLYDTAGGYPAPEFDIEEYYGSAKDTSTDTMHDHSPNYNSSTYNAGYDLSADFHDRTGVWTSATLDKYLDGELVGHHVPNADVNGATMFLLYNFGLDSGIYPGDPDTENGATDTALANNPNPALRIDRTTVFQFA